MCEILISLTGTLKKSVQFFVKSFHLPFHYDLSSTNLTFITSYMCLFMCKRHLKHCYVKRVENDSRKKKKNYKTHAKKSTIIFFVPSQRYQDYRHLLQNPEVLNYVMGFSNRAQRFNPSQLLELNQPRQ